MRICVVANEFIIPKVNRIDRANGFGSWREFIHELNHILFVRNGDVESSDFARADAIQQILQALHIIGCNGK